MIGTAAAVAGEGLDPNSVSPGLIGFLATFGLVLASILLFWNMNARLRRMRHREDQEAAERAAREEPDAGDDGTGDEPDDDGGRRE